MLKVKSTDLRERCFDFGVAVIKLVDSLPHKISTKIIADQIVRASTSIGANLIEGKAASSRLEYKRFFEIALKSANETRYWLQIMYKTEMVEQTVFEELNGEVTELCNMIGAAVLKLKGKK